MGNVAKFSGKNRVLCIIVKNVDGFFNNFKEKYFHKKPLLNFLFEIIALSRY